MIIFIFMHKSINFKLNQIIYIYACLIVTINIKLTYPTKLSIGISDTLKGVYCPKIIGLVSIYVCVLGSWTTKNKYSCKLASWTLLGWMNLSIDWSVSYKMLEYELVFIVFWLCFTHFPYTYHRRLCNTYISVWSVYTFKIPLIDHIV